MAVSRTPLENLNMKTHLILTSESGTIRPNNELTSWIKFALWFGYRDICIPRTVAMFLRLAQKLNGNLGRVRGRFADLPFCPLVLPSSVAWLSLFALGH